MNRQIPQENPLWKSWHDTQMMAALSPQTVMDYFCHKSNPFYDRFCNNETIRMQRLSLEHLNNMVGVEYILLHVFEPILYVVRKQHRHSPTEATPMADYYIIGGMVYKAPDLASVINSRLLSTVTNLQSAFEEASSYSRYHPNKGYTWDFSANKSLSEKAKQATKKDTTTKDDSATVFQKQRVDMLLADLLRRFRPPIPPVVHQQLVQSAQEIHNAGNNETTGNAITNGIGNANEATASGIEAMDDMKPPPEKKLKLEPNANSQR